MLDWETGIEIGRAIERIAANDRRMDRIETDHGRRMDTIEAHHEHLQAEVSEAKILAMRVGLVVLLWLGGMAITMPAEKGAEFMANFIKAFLK